MKLNHIANSLSIGDGIECIKKRKAFIGLKVHEKFRKQAKMPAIYPVYKSDPGKFSKMILDKVNKNLRSIFTVNY